MNNTRVVAAKSLTFISLIMSIMMGTISCVYLYDHSLIESHMNVEEETTSASTSTITKTFSPQPYIPEENIVPDNNYYQPPQPVEEVPSSSSEVTSSNETEPEETIQTSNDTPPEQSPAPVVTMNTEPLPTQPVQSPTQPSSPQVGNPVEE